MKNARFPMARRHVVVKGWRTFTYPDRPRRATVQSFVTGRPSGYYRFCPVHFGGRITSKTKALKEVTRHHWRCHDQPR